MWIHKEEEDGIVVTRGQEWWGRGRERVDNRYRSTLAWEECVRVFCSTGQ
jgi:hypothetical protein